LLLLFCCCLRCCCCCSLFSFRWCVPITLVRCWCCYVDCWFSWSLLCYCSTFVVVI
jgi:hypothetical protein